MIRQVYLCNAIDAAYRHSGDCRSWFWEDCEDNLDIIRKTELGSWLAKSWNLSTFGGLRISVGIVNIERTRCHTVGVPCSRDVAQNGKMTNPRCNYAVIISLTQDVIGQVSCTKLPSHRYKKALCEMGLWIDYVIGCHFLTLKAYPRSVGEEHWSPATRSVRHPRRRNELLLLHREWELSDCLSW